MNKRYWLRMLVIVSVLIPLMFAFHNCGQVQIKKAFYPEIGEPQLLKVVADEKSDKADGEYKNVHVYFAMGGRTLYYDEDIIIEVYNDEKDKEPVYSFTPKDLTEMHNETKCSLRVSKKLENSLLGDALFCNNSFDLSKVNYIVARRKNKRDKVATSYISEKVDKDLDLITLTINMY